MAILKPRQPFEERKNTTEKGHGAKKRTRIAAALLCGTMAVTGIPFFGGEMGAKALDVSTVKINSDMSITDLGASSGVPLGGIGTGCFDFAADGRLKNIKLNNTENNYFPGNLEGFLFALWDSKSGEARRLQRDDYLSLQNGMIGYEHSRYTGLFPTAELELYDSVNQTPVAASISAFSPLTAQNVKDSSLPVAFFEVTLTNTTQEAIDASVAFSFEDILGRGIKEPETLNEIPSNIVTVNGPAWGMLETPDTTAETISLSGYQGVHQYTETLGHKKDTFQNYNTDVLLLADTAAYNADGNAAGTAKVSTLLSYLPHSFEDETWFDFSDNGVLSDGKQTAALSQKGGDGAASVVTASVDLPAGGVTKVRFLVSWFAEETEKKPNTNRQSYGTADYNKYYHNFFSDISSLTSYAVENRDSFRAKIAEWQQPILDSSMEPWLKFKQINSGYVLYTNSILNKGGCFSSMEGGMMGLTGTSDQRLSSHAIYQKMFSQLDDSENRLFAITLGDRNQIMHFTGNYYVGLPNITSEKESPMNGNGWMIDNSMSWVIQMAKEYLHTGDESIIQDNQETVKGIIDWLSTKQISAVNGVTLQLPQGPTTYDDKEHPEVMSYSGSTYLATLEAGKVFAQALGDTALYNKCEQLAAAGRDSMNSEYLWNGKYYAYGYGSKGEHEGRVDYVFSGMLAGQFLARLTGWQDILPFERIASSVQTQISTSVLDAPGYYAPKVYDAVNKINKDNGSGTWPFYLDSYTGMLAIQSGYVDDGLTVLKSTQQIYLDQGYTWSMSLWQPNNICTYMTAPVSWFIGDVLTGFAVDLPNKTMTVGPADLGDTFSIPVYYPDFWGRLDYSKKDHTASFTVTKRFGNDPISIETIVVQPNGTSSDERASFSIDGFSMEEGATYTFTADMVAAMERSVKQEAILPEYSKPYEPVIPVEPGTGTGLKETRYFEDGSHREISNTDVNYSDNSDWNLSADELENYAGSIWEGEIQIYYGGLPEYQFLLRTDGNCKLWINDQLVLSTSSNGQIQEFTSSAGLYLTPGEKYSIRLEYRNTSSQPVCQLYWQLNPHNMDVVPINQLYAPASPDSRQPVFTNDNEAPTNMGDIDCDGAVDASDALKALQHSVHLVELSGNTFAAGDVNRDHLIDASDALKILQYSVKLVSSF